MLAMLHEAERNLQKLVRARGEWRGMRIDYEYPHIDRLWRPFGDGRVYLHLIHPCRLDQAQYHPHRWPSAMRVVRGTYEMSLGFGAGQEKPPIFSHLVLHAGDEYEMTHPDGWHAVSAPQGCLTIMVSGSPWSRWAPKQKEGHQFPEMTSEIRDTIFSEFNLHYHLLPI